MAWYFGAAVVLPVLLALYFTESITAAQKRLFLGALPVLIAAYFRYGDELKSKSVSWKDIVKNDKVISVLENKQKTFTLKNREISVSLNSNISHKDLNVLLLKWGINPSGMDENDIKHKINLLLKVSSPDFWRKNYNLHPKKGRISNWIWIHNRYLNQLSSLKQIKDKEKLKKKFIKFTKKLEGHANYEDVMMFKFLKENVKVDILPIIDDLTKEHDPSHKAAKDIINQFDTLNLEEIVKKMEDFEKPLIEHFTKEEQNIIPVFLNLDNALYRTYRSYLSWKYCVMY